MVYTKQEKQEIERVLAVFAKYLNQRNHCDIAWSNKLGYLLLDYHTYVDDVTPIGTAADLCREMLDYMMIVYIWRSCFCPKTIAVLPIGNIIEVDSTDSAAATVKHAVTKQRHHQLCIRHPAPLHS